MNYKEGHRLPRNAVYILYCTHILACRAEKLANAFIKKDSRNFWSEIQKIKGFRNRSSVVGSVDQAVGDKAILNVFTNKYKVLYNCV